MRVSCMGKLDVDKVAEDYMVDATKEPVGEPLSAATSAAAG